MKEPNFVQFANLVLLRQQCPDVLLLCVYLHLVDNCTLRPGTACNGKIICVRVRYHDERVSLVLVQTFFQWAFILEKYKEKIRFIDCSENNQVENQENDTLKKPKIRTHFFAFVFVWTSVIWLPEL